MSVGLVLNVAGNSSYPMDILLVFSILWASCSLQLPVRDGKEPSLFGFGSVQVLVKFVNGGL